jgi:hypothetical protein
MKTIFNAFLHHFLQAPNFLTLEDYFCGLFDYAFTQ